MFERLLPKRPTPERCVEAYYLQRTRFERIAERQLRRRELTEDGNLEINDPTCAGLQVVCRPGVRKKDQ
jgi:hypothetical protein